MRANLVEQIIHEIDTCLENGECIAALYMALTLPDLCGKAEYPNDNVGTRYKKWFDTFITPYERPSTPSREDVAPYLSGEVVYSLRNQLLHQGTPTIDATKINNLNNKTDEFILILEDGNDFDLYGNNSSYSLRLNGEEIRKHNVSVRNFCMIISRTALGFFKENVQKFNFITVEFADKRTIKIKKLYK